MHDARTVVFLNGRFLEDAAGAAVSLFDRGYLLGDGLFETLRAYGGRVFRGALHLDRLASGARRLEIPLPHEPSEIHRLVHEAVAHVGADDVYVRVTLSRGEGGPGVAIRGDERPTFSIVARPSAPYPPDAYERGIASGVAETRRIPPACLPPELKTTYLPNVLARRELDRRGLLEGVMLSVDGRVVSGTVSNVFVVRGRELWTPHPGSGCRPGVTREAVLELAPSLDLAVVERDLTVDDVRSADELFFTNTAMECLGAARFEDRAYGPGRKVTRRLHDALARTIREETRGG